PSDLKIISNSTEPFFSLTLLTIPSPHDLLITLSPTCQSVDCCAFFEDVTRLLYPLFSGCLVADLNRFPCVVARDLFSFSNKSSGISFKNLEAILDCGLPKSILDVACVKYNVSSARVIAT